MDTKKTRFTKTFHDILICTHHFRFNIEHNWRCLPVTHSWQIFACFLNIKNQVFYMPSLNYKGGKGNTFSFFSTWELFLGSYNYHMYAKYLKPRYKVLLPYLHLALHIIKLSYCSLILNASDLFNDFVLWH
jgi:hypothetical protein